MAETFKLIDKEKGSDLTDAEQLKQWREYAKQTVDRFVRRFHESYRLLAYHAALPLVLTPELVNYLRNEFLRGEKVPWVAEVDLLLSDLCSQVGYELYAMDTHVRAYLLEEMEKDSRLGRRRMQKVARVLISYVSYLSRLNPGRRQQEIEAQRWAAMVYLGDEQCKTAAREIAEHLLETSSGTGSENLSPSGIRAELARLTRITEELSHPLQQEPSLLKYARLVQQILRNPDRVNPDELRHSYPVADVELRFPISLLPEHLAQTVAASRVRVPQFEGFPPIQTFTYNVATLEDETQTHNGINLQSWEFEVVQIKVNHSLLSNTDNLLEILAQQVFTQTGENLNDLQQLILKGVFANQTYQQIAAQNREYEEDLSSEIKRGSNLAKYLRHNVAPNLWKVLSEVLGEKVTKRDAKKVIEQWAKSRQLTINRHQRQGQSFIQDLGNEVQLEMVAIPEGKFFMGTEHEEIQRLTKKFGDYFKYESPQHQVTIQPFSMSKYPITQRQWKAIAEQTDLKVNEDLEPLPSYHKDNPESFSFPATRGNLDLPYYGNNPTYLDRPVEQVNWYQAKEFCDRLSKLTGKEYRLPTEAEWEYACRAVTSYQSSGTSKQLRIEEWNKKYQQPFHFGETITSDLANYRGTEIYADEPKGVYRGETTPVGMFPPNAFGLYDLHGNVWEWCEDDWHDNYNDAPPDGSAWLDQQERDLKLIRGGSFDSNPNNCRSAYRHYKSARDSFNHVYGFRVVCVLPRTS